jgi:hypothetical protein
MKFAKQKKILLPLISIFLIAGLFLVGHIAQADNIFAKFISGFLSVIVAGLGVILVLVIQSLIAIASVQQFITAQVVVTGWVIVRDICNMFFVVVLIIIAFGTILHLENYNYKKWLPKLILMAVLINFSKTICGLLIDVAQVVMLTFVNAFKDIGGANITDILGIQKIITLAKNSQEGVTEWSVAGAYLLGLVYLLVSIVVILTMLMMLVMRLVMIWIYVVLSPLAYLLAAFPGGEKYASQWWSEFIKNLVVGPVLAFFIWLSLASLSATSNTVVVSSSQDSQTSADITSLGLESVSTNVNLGPTEGASAQALISFVVAIGMLVGGLMVSQSIGGAAGSIAGKGMSALQKGQGLVTGTAMKGLKGIAKAPMLPVNYGVDKLHQSTGIDLNLKRSWGALQSKRKEIKDKRYAEGQTAAGRAMEEGGRTHGILAMTGNSGDAYEQITTWKGFKKRIKGGRAMDKDRKIAENQEKSDQKRFDEVEYEDKFANSDKSAREEMLQESQEKYEAASVGVTNQQNIIKDIDKNIVAEEAKGQYKDNNRLAELRTKKNESEEKLQQHQEDMTTWNYRGSFDKNRVYDDKEKFDIKQRKNTAANDLDQTKSKIEKNTPEYNFEARAAEQHAISEEVSKIKDITDPAELLRILQDAIKSKDKTLVKAIALKMTKDGNDNEFLRPLAGRTDHKGLKKLMRDFADKNSNNYAGFTEQEAFGLGSQIAEINKGTNHAAATAAYTMENGRWRETTDKEHHQIRDVETGKQQLQAFIRNNNRLAYGYHDKTGKFHLDAGGVLKLKAINNLDGFSNISTMNESAAKYCYDAIKEANKNDKLTEFTQAIKDESDEVIKDKDGNEQSLMRALERRLGKLTDKENFDAKYDEVNEYE